MGKLFVLCYNFIMKCQKEIFEVIFYARGGQGAKVASEILAQAAASEGKFVQAFPEFGPERSGAPVKTYLRVSDKEIRTHEPVVDPDAVAVLDETILESEDVLKNLDKNEVLVINTRKSEYEIKEKLKSKGKKFEGKIYPIDANRISMELVGQLRPNTVILGKLVQISEITSLESVIEKFRQVFEEKIGLDATEKNIQAIERAYDSI